MLYKHVLRAGRAVIGVLALAAVNQEAVLILIIVEVLLIGLL